MSQQAEHEVFTQAAQVQAMYQFIRKLLPDDILIDAEHFAERVPMAQFKLVTTVREIVDIATLLGIMPQDSATPATPLAEGGNAGARYEIIPLRMRGVQKWFIRHTETKLLAVDSNGDNLVYDNLTDANTAVSELNAQEIGNGVQE